MSSERPVIFSIRRMRARGRRQQARQVARAIADHRQRFLGERREHELALFALRQHLAGFRIDDLGIEVVLPDREPVLGLDAFLRDARPDDLATGRRCRSHRATSWSRSPRASRASTARRRRCRSAASMLGSRPCFSISSAIASMYDGVTMMIFGLKSKISCTWRSVMPPDIGITVHPSFSAP